MKIRVLIRAASPYLGVVGVVALLAMLLGAIYYTWLELQWIAFLAGILVAAVLALVSRASQSEWVLLRRTAQLAALRDKFAEETVARTGAEEKLAAADRAGREIGEALPAMLARIDGEQRCRFHNRAFRKLTEKGVRAIDGRPLRKVLGAAHYAAIAQYVVQALAGRAAIVERTQSLPDGTTVSLLEQYLPLSDETGKEAGCFLLVTNVGGAVDRPALSSGGAEPLAPERVEEQALYADAIARELTEGENIAVRLKAALENDEFRLYVQTIMPLAGAPAPPFFEILSRLQDEENNLLPPGVFVPLAENHGLLHLLDRWVVQRLLRWASEAPARRNALYSINVSATTLGDPGFATHVREQLAVFGLPGAMLCFEFAETEVLNRPNAVTIPIRELREAGCRVALCGVGRNLMPIGMLRRLQVDFLKIDSRVIYNIERDAAELAKVRAIGRVARTMGIATIAELVESNAAIELLRSAGIDFAQGFAISQPRPLQELE